MSRRRCSLESADFVRTTREAVNVLALVVSADHLNLSERNAAVAFLSAIAVGVAYDPTADKSMRRRGRACAGKHQTCDKNCC